MELLEYVAKQLHCYLSDFHYKSKVMDAGKLLFDLLEAYSLEEWVSAYQYIFYDEQLPHGKTAVEIYDEIYDRLASEGTPLDPKN